jgi:hypothetical protein
MSTPQVYIAQSLADAWALKAQEYAGYFYGHPVRAGQHGKSDAGRVYVDESRPWQEPIVFADDCDFCRMTTDERVEERIAGFQEAIDIEVVRGKTRHLYAWMAAKGYPNLTREVRRQFLREMQDVPTERRPKGFRLAALDLTQLPMHLKRRLCIEWNHLLRDWLEQNKAAFYYDFDAHEIKPHGMQPAADEGEARAERELNNADARYAQTPLGGWWWH